MERIPGVVEGERWTYYQYLISCTSPTKRKDTSTAGLGGQIQSAASVPGIQDFTSASALMVLGPIAGGVVDIRFTRP